MTEEKLDLAQEQCVAPSGNEMPLPINDALNLLQNLHQAWSINSSGHLERVFLARDFSRALYVANLLGQVAKEAAYYPDMLIAYGILRVEIWAHNINGLWRSDFVLAAKFDHKIASLEERLDV